MAERDIPELVKFVIDNRNAEDMAASLANFKTDMGKFLRTVESSAQALDFIQSKLKQIITDPKSKDFGMGIQEIIVDARDAATVEQALRYKNASFRRKDPEDPENILESPYSIKRQKVKTSSGTISLHGEDAFKQAQEKIKQKGGDIWRSPTEDDSDTVTYFFPVNTRATKKSIEKDYNEIFTEAIETSNKYLELKEQKDNELKKESNVTINKTLSSVKAILSVLGVISDITRRILTATLTNASETNRKTIEAQNVGMSYAERRDMDIFDIAHGMERGTLFGAVSSIQSKFGDVTKLDTNALGVLARVMGNEVGDLVRSGLGGKNPDVLMEKILDKYFAQYKSGKNSLGQRVGQAQARRELVTVLQSVSPELATVFSRMIDDSLSGRYGNFSTTREWYGTTITNRGGLGESDLTLVSEIGKMWNSIKASTEDIKNLWENKIIIGLNDLLKGIENSRIGMTATQNIALTNANKERNIESLQRGNELLTSYNKQAEARIKEIEKATPSGLRGIQGKYTYSAETLAGIISGAYTDTYFKENYIANSGMRNRDREYKDYYDRGVEVAYEALRDKDISDEIAMAAATLNKTKILRMVLEKDDPKMGDKSFTTAELVVSAKDLIDRITKQIPQFWEGAAPELRKGTLEGYKKWLLKESSSATEAADLSDLALMFAGEQNLTGQRNNYVYNWGEDAAKRLYGGNWKNKIKKEIEKLEQSGMSTKEAQAEILAPLGVGYWYNNSVVPKQNFNSTAYQYFIEATRDAYVKSLEASNSKIQSLLLQQTSIPQNASSWYGSMNQNGVYVVQFKNESGTVINSVELGKLGEVGQMEGVVSRDDNGNTYFEVK